MIQRSNNSFHSPHFVSVPFRDGILLDLSDDTHPTCAHGWGHAGGGLQLDDGGTHYGYVIDGNPTLMSVDCGWSMPYKLGPGMYFSVPGWLHLEGGSGVVISRQGYRGTFSLGGPIEEQGRMRYIDGCSDSLLIPPVLKGDPCLNHLHFPAGIDQTRHTHPSLRVGIVARGEGRCVVPENDDGSGDDVTIPLIPGNVFVIPTNGQHSFFTDDSMMDIIAYHPDSDTGPTHEDHPMINRTLVDGVSAAKLDDIRTTLEELEHQVEPLQN